MLWFEKLRLPHLHQRPVFITGCDSGFGQLLSLKLLQENIPVFAGCLTENGKQVLESLAKTLPGKLYVMKIDVRQTESLKEARTLVENQLEGLDLWGLVCNAGIPCAPCPDDFMTCDDYVTTCDVNTFGVIRTCHIFKELIKKSRGRFVIMSSMLGRLTLPCLGPYVVSKHAVEGYADTLRLETSCFGCTVHVIEPGFFKTGIISHESWTKNSHAVWAKAPERLRRQYGHEYITEFLEANKKAVDRNSTDDLSPVLHAYFDSLTAKFPKSRYVVGWDAVYLSRLVRFLPIWIGDIVIDFLSRREKIPLPKNAHLPLDKYDCNNF